MKRCLLWVKLFVMACIMGCYSGVQAQNFEADESNPLITVVSPTGDTQLTSNCTWKPEKGNDNYLPENNEAYYDADNHLGTLIDNNLNTYWHSDPVGMDLRKQDEWIQADLVRNDLTRIIMMLNRREDIYDGAVRHGITPVIMDIYATNTPDDESSWTFIKKLSDMPASDTEGAWPYYGYIELPEAYRYLRLIPRQSSGTPGSTFAYWTFAELQFYPAVPIVDKKQILQNVVDSVYALKRDFKVGESAGYVSKAAYDKYMSDFASCLDLIDNPNVSNDDIIAGIATLRKAIADITASVNPIADGWYFIVAGDSSFVKTQGVDKAFYADDKELNWGTLDSQNPYYYFYVKRMEDGNLSFRNGANDKYVYTVPGDAWVSAVYVKMNDTDTIHQTVEPIGNGCYYIANTANANPYHPLSHSSGAGDKGKVSPASVYENISLWRFVPVDASRLDELKEIQTKKDKANALADSIVEARTLIFTIKAPTTGIIKAASQMTTNCAWTAANGVDKLIDNDHNTHFHSTTAKDLRKQDEWIQIDLNRTDVSKLTIEHWGRNDGAATGKAWHDTPTKYVVKATNTPEDESSWKEVALLEKGFPGNIHNAHYVSPLIDMKNSYRYVRLYVKAVSSGNAYWNLSELQLYTEDVEASESSMYSKNAEMKKAVDDLAAALAVADDHISNLTVDGTEMISIRSSMAVINDLLNSADRIQAIVNSAEDFNKKLYSLSSEGGLITEVNSKNDGTTQLTANNTWMGITPDNDNYSFNAAFIEDGYNLLGALIDNDDQTYWHSDPSWSTLLERPSYLQIDFKRSDISSFLVRIDRRNDLYKGSHRAGITPATAIIYGTNDDALGADVNSDLGSWTEIAALNDFPDVNNYSLWPYYSRDITPDRPYRYIRFRVTNSCSSVPYWTISGFQIYDAKDRYDNAKSQYYYVEGMKDAADKMMKLAAEVQGKLDNGCATIADGQELQDAINAVRALYQDHEAFDKIIDKAKKFIENATVGEYMGQLKDESKLTELQAAVDAAAGVHTSTAKFNELKKNVEDALEAVYDKVVSVEPGKWYYILSATADEDSSPAGYYGARNEVKGAALYVLGSGKGEDEGVYYAGSQLRWGMDDIKNKEREGDIDAIWRFVPVPDSLNLGKRAYYIQNMRTGWYVGNANALNNDYYFNGSATPFPFRVECVGREQFQIQALSGNRKGALMSFGDNARQVRADLLSADFDSRASFTFEEFDAEENSEIAMQFENNTAKIVTLPFAIASLGINDGVVAYQIHSQPSETELGLVAKDEFAAGEPFILVTGDTTLYEKGEPKVTLMFETPADLSIKGDTVNGLVAAFNGCKLADAGYGYFSGNALMVSDGKTKASVNAHSGYISPGLIQTAEGTPDLVISTLGGGILNKIKEAVGKLNTTVDVYTIDGVPVRHNVKAADAKKGLGKGLYIIGREKVLIK